MIFSPFSSEILLKKIEIEDQVEEWKKIINLQILHAAIAASLHALQSKNIIYSIIENPALFRFNFHGINLGTNVKVYKRLNNILLDTSKHKTQINPIKYT